MNLKLRAAGADRSRGAMWICGSVFGSVLFC
jgi:hypothetical protein